MCRQSEAVLLLLVTAQKVCHSLDTWKQITQHMIMVVCHIEYMSAKVYAEVIQGDISSCWAMSLKPPECTNLSA